MLTEEERKARKRAYSAKWRAENKERHRAYNAKWRVENKERHRSHNAKWNANNPEKRRAYSKKWKAKNPEKKKAYNAKWKGKNKERHQAYTEKWQANNPERVAATKRKRNYGITDLAYNRMCDEQGFTCAICQSVTVDNTPTKYPGRAKPLSVDHHHGSGKVRGLLCNNCNTGLGFMRESITTLRYAIQYLLDHQQH